MNLFTVVSLLSLCIFHVQCDEPCKIQPEASVVYIVDSTEENFDERMDFVQRSMIYSLNETSRPAVVTFAEESKINFKFSISNAPERSNHWKKKKDKKQRAMVASRTDIMKWVIDIPSVSTSEKTHFIPAIMDALDLFARHHHTVEDMKKEIVLVIDAETDDAPCEDSELLEQYNEFNITMTIFVVNEDEVFNTRLMDRLSCFLDDADNPTNMR